jgi:membrane glycosyltransferase
VEVIFSTLFAPIRMLFHSKFVFVTLLGQQVGWGGQQRSDLGTTWSEALRFHGFGTAFAFAWAAVLFLVNRSFFWWNTPIFIPLLISIPLSVWSSRASLGRAFRRLGLFVIPEEAALPPELQFLNKDLEQQQARRKILPLPDEAGFARAVVDPQVNMLHRSLLRTGRKVSQAIAARRRELCEKALSMGPGSLSVQEKKELLYDPRCMEELHRRVWETTDQAQAALWGLAA